MCLLAAAPGTEHWLKKGGLPDSAVTVTGLGAAAVGCITLITTLKAALKAAMQPRSCLHLAAETGIIGGPLEGAVDYPGGSGEFCVRIVCERHWIKISKTSDGSSQSHEISTQYEDTYRASAENGLIPVRFGIPFQEPETSVDRRTPVHLWFVELEDPKGNKLDRFPVPVFKTPDSNERFELRDASADRLIEEESPEDVLQRYGISVMRDDSSAGTGRTVIHVPPRRSGGQAWVWTIFGIVCLGIAVFMGSKIFVANRNFGAIIEITAGVIFGGVFGLFGLMMAIIGLQLLLERRRIEIDGHEIRVRRSYFGIGWQSTLQWDAVHKIKTTYSGSSSGRRGRYENVVAVTDGMRKKNGSSMSRDRSLINTVPTEAAEAAKSLLLSLKP